LYFVFVFLPSIFLLDFFNRIFGRFVASNKGVKKRDRKNHRKNSAAAKTNSYLLTYVTFFSSTASLGLGLGLAPAFRLPPFAFAFRWPLPS
jgi:hypothetical protein